MVLDLDIDFSMPDYGEFVDKGRRPGKQPPISAIKPWLQIKGIPEKFAFPIARNIGKKGIKAVPFFGTTIDSKIQELTSQLTIAYTKDLDNYIQKQIDQKVLITIMAITILSSPSNPIEPIFVEGGWNNSFVLDSNEVKFLFNEICW
jgi:hypothetical protein